MYCSNCGHKIEDNEVFCIMCGTSKAGLEVEIEDIDSSNYSPYKKIRKMLLILVLFVFFVGVVYVNFFTPKITKEWVCMSDYFVLCNKTFLEGDSLVFDNDRYFFVKSLTSDEEIMRGTYSRLDTSLVLKEHGNEENIWYEYEMTLKELIIIDESGEEYYFRKK